MAQTTRTDRGLPAQQRRARQAAELRSNLRKRKQQARSRAQRLDAGNGARGEGKVVASKGPGGAQGETA